MACLPNPCVSYVWWHKSVIPLFGRQRQKHPYKFKLSLTCIVNCRLDKGLVRPCLQTNKIPKCPWCYLLYIDYWKLCLSVVLLSHIAIIPEQIISPKSESLILLMSNATVPDLGFTHTIIQTISPASVRKWQAWIFFCQRILSFDPMPKISHVNSAKHTHSISLFQWGCEYTASSALMC